MEVNLARRMTRAELIGIVQGELGQIPAHRARNWRWDQLVRLVEDLCKSAERIKTVGKA